MMTRLAVLIGILVLSASTDQTTVRASARPDGDTLSVTDWAAHARFLQASIKVKSSEQIQQIISMTPSRNIAIVAAWERLRRTFPENRVELAAHLDTESSQRFLGVFESRLGHVVPGWWEAGLEEARSHHRDRVWFDKTKISDLEPESDGFIPIKVPNGVTVESVDGGTSLAIKSGGRQVKVSTDLANRLGIIESVSILCTPTRWYIALHCGSAGGGYSLCCIDLSTGDELWIEVGWGAETRSSATGAGWSRSTIQMNDSEVAVFGMATEGAYVETYDLMTGEPRVRFCTTLWSRWIPEISP